MYVIITRPLCYCYGPFSTRKAAIEFAESTEFKSQDCGECVIRRIEAPKIWRIIK